MREREFLEHAKNCSNPACMADAKLRAYGARLRPGKGRHCELLMLAAAGADGLSDVELVLGRRAQAEHLGVTSPVQRPMRRTQRMRATRRMAT